MAQLQYKTRGNSSPQGKPRVYFCCHPEDFSPHFPALSDALLAAQDCALWYGTDVSPEDLAQMQLFVLPVTGKLLTTPNEALDRYFPFAVETGIPVLPVVLEPGLDGLFGEKCGQLQYLDRCSNDATAIRFEEKLQTYLRTVLVGDELARKVRAAFDAYVFLSYRKKDRSHAQELMRLIHQHDFCRDIAIWYDEFLSPGEDFNESIRAALEKSGLFVLTVTPNVVNEPNYIMQTEYPMARQTGKPILPVQMVPTDAALLQEKYEAIPELADAHDPLQLSQSLLQSLKRIAIRENDGSPEHNFFIGLAYLNGIDVELDRQRGLALISSAAGDGLPEAAQKLFDIYLNGAGAPRDISQASMWLKRWVQLLAERFRQDRTYENLAAYISGLELCARHAEKAVGSRQLAIEEYGELVKFCQRAYRHFPMLGVKRQLGSGYLKLAQLHQQNGNTELFELYAIDAVDCLENVRQELEAELARDVAAITVKDLAEYYSVFGLISDLCFAKAGCRALHQDPEGEAQYIQKGVEAAQHMAQHLKGDENIRLSLAGAYCNAAKYYLKYKHYAQAQEYLDKGHALASQIGQVTHWLTAGELVITFGMLRAELSLEQGDVSAALACWQENCKALEQSDLTPAMKGTLCVNYEKVAEHAFRQEDYRLCAETTEKCLRLYAQILNNRDFVTVQTKLCRMLALSNARMGQSAPAISVAQKLFQVKYQDHRELNSPQAALEYSESMYLLAQTYHETGDYGSALATYKNGIRFSQTVMLQYLSVGDVNLENTVNACLAAAQVCKDMGKPGTAVSWMNKALTIRKRVYKAQADPQGRERLADCYRSCAQLLTRMGKPQKAQKFLREAQKLS